MKKLLLILSMMFGLALSPIAGWGQTEPVTDQQLGLQFYNDRDFVKAAEVFERLYKSKPSHFTYTYYLQSLLEIGDIEQAGKLVKQQSRQFPKDAKYEVDEGYILIRGNQNAKAMRLFDDLVKELKPDQREVIELANAFSMRREYDYAIQTYQKGRQMLAPEYTFGFELAQMYELQGQYDKMVDEYLNMIAQFPDQTGQVQARLQNTLLNDPENQKSDALHKALVMQVQKKPDDIMLSELLAWLSMQLEDFESALVQVKALDRRQGENGSRVFALGQLCMSNNNYKVATDAFTYVMNHTDDPSMRITAEVELLKSEYQQVTSAYPVITENMLKLEQKYKTTIEKNSNNPLSFPLISNLAHMEAFYLNNPPLAISLLEELIAKTNNNLTLQAESKLELADILLFSGEPWEATLLYSQVDKAFKNDPLGHEARFRNARLSFYIGEFDWARAQLDVLKAATSKLIANDAMYLSLLISDNIDMDSSTLALASFARADLLLFRNQPVKAFELLDSILIAFPGHLITDDVLMKKAEIKLKEGDFAQTETLYKAVLEQFPDDILADDALFNLATLYKDHMNDRQKAMDAYQKLMTYYPGSLYVVEARKQFRDLRGDFQKTGQPELN